MRPGSTEYAIFVCFEVGMYSITPLERENRLGNHDISFPVSFFYGDKDWMDYKAGERVIVNNKFYNQADPKAGLSQVYIISNSDHHLYLDNPDEFA